MEKLKEVLSKTECSINTLEHRLEYGDPDPNAPGK